MVGQPRATGWLFNLARSAPPQERQLRSLISGIQHTGARPEATGLMVLSGGCRNRQEASVTFEMRKPLSKPPAHAEELVYRANLATVREFIATRARRAGLPARRVNDLVLAISELAANTLAHTSGPGTLLVWATDEDIICQVHDGGHLSEPDPGGARPEPDALGGGRGLWVVRQICDRVEIWVGENGTTIRAYMSRPAVSV